MTTKLGKPHHQTLTMLADREAMKNLALGAGFEGIRRSDIQRAVGRTESCVLSNMAVMAKEGLVERSHTNGQHCRWGPPGIWAHHQGSRDMAAARREARRNGIGYVEPVIVHRIVPAAEAPPIRQRAPCSVWEWAQRA